MWLLSSIPLKSAYASAAVRIPHFVLECVKWRMTPNYLQIQSSTNIRTDRLQIPKTGPL